MPSNRTQFLIAGLLIFTGGIFSGAKIFEAGLDEAAAVAVGTKSVTSTDIVTNNSTPQTITTPQTTTPTPVSLQFDIEGTVPLSSSPSYVAVSGGFAYSANKVGKKLQIIDVSSQNPVVVSTVSTAVQPVSVALSGNYLYMFGMSTAGSNLQIFDVTNKTNPQPVRFGVGESTTFPLPGSPVDMAVSSNNLYVVHSGGILEVYNVAIPSSMSKVGSLAIQSTYEGVPSALSAVALSGNYAFIPSQTENEFHVVNVSNPSAPVLATTISMANDGVRGRSSDITLVGRYAYVAMPGRSQIAVVDTYDPRRPRVLDLISTGTNSKPFLLATGDSYLYTAKEGAGIVTLLDISQPQTPRVVSSVQTGSLWAGSLAAFGNRVFIGGRSLTPSVPNLLSIARVVSQSTSNIR